MNIKEVIATISKVIDNKVEYQNTLKSKPPSIDFMSSMAEKTMIEFLTLNIEELKYIKDDLLKCSIKVSQDQLVEGAKECCRMEADTCCTDFEDNWKIYSDLFKCDVMDILKAMNIEVEGETK